MELYIVQQLKHFVLPAANVEAAVFYVSSVVFMLLDYHRNKCSPKNGTFGTLQMLLSHEVDVIFGPVCSRGRP